MAKLWSYSTGEYGATVRAFERQPGGPLYLRLPSRAGGYVKRALGHRDRELARRQAAEAALELLAGHRPQGRSPELKVVLTLYHRHALAERGITEATRLQREQQRDLWLAVLGPDFRPEDITVEDWRRAAQLRLTGAVDARGNPVPEDERRPLRPDSVNHDLKYLRAALRWAAAWRPNRGQPPLLSRYPLGAAAFPTLRRREARRPVATVERYLRLRAVEHRMSAVRDGRRVSVPSYFREVLDLCVLTTRRISAVRRLTFDDVRWDRRPEDDEPYGAILWSWQTDKVGKSRTIPMTPLIRDALERARAHPLFEPDRIWVFPAPDAPTQPVGRSTLTRWLREAEQLAELEHLEHGGYHSFRRMWASRRRDRSIVDVAGTGGWESKEVLRDLYQHTDKRTMLDVLLDAELERKVLGPKLAQNVEQVGELTA